MLRSMYAHDSVVLCALYRMYLWEDGSVQYKEEPPYLHSQRLYNGCTGAFVPTISLQLLGN